MRSRVLFPLAFAALLVTAAPASASGGDVIQDCTRNGTLTKHYSQRDYQQALASLPADVDEYGNCRDIIRNAETAAAANNGSKGADGTSSAATVGLAGPPTPPSGGVGGTSTGGANDASTAQGDDPTAVDPANATAGNPTTPNENQALIDATRNGGGAIRVGRDAIRPGAQNSSFAQGMPAPLLGVLALLGVAALAGGALAVRRKLHAGG
ncbi:MAG TPA: hypothetical protein VHR88_06545 [Solirubrobacteraceae bacterium]|jgi:hypothetical protein|nr:hypothetical protein [Solirubrobacteraceae bacterium]